MIKPIITKLKNTIKNLDKKALKILKYGLKFCFVISLLSMAFLTTYLFFLHNYYIYQIGILIFQLSLCFTAEFIVSAIAVDTIKKQII